MLRGSVLAAVTISLLASNIAYAGQEHIRVKTQKAKTCHAKIDPKNLKGAAFKTEWDKCIVNPDNYS
jgi:hypothetical protein